MFKACESFLKLIFIPILLISFLALYTIFNFFESGAIKNLRDVGELIVIAYCCKP